MNKVFYIGFYDISENAQEGRSNNLAASNKMTYIISAMEKLGYSVEVVSPSATTKNKFIRGKMTPIGERSKLRLFTTWPYRPRVLRILGRYCLRAEMMWYLLRHIKKGDTVLVYHSLALMDRIRWLKRLKKIRLILEVEEIYGDVLERQNVSDSEQKFFQNADGYLFPASRLERKVNIDNKPCVFIHGTYQAEDNCGAKFEKPEWRDKIHCVYAGTFDPRKGGVQMAVKAASFLPAEYHMHILGAGSEEDRKNIQKEIEKINQLNGCTISYDGCLQGEEFIRFLQSCHIGLSTQNPKAAFNDTSFPSKILTYMANGLQVVTVRIPVVEESAVHQYMHYYDKPEPEQIAKTICLVAECKDQVDVRSAIADLDRGFLEDMRKLLAAE